MKEIEKKISGLILGSLFPLSFGLLSVIIWFFVDKSESTPIIYLAIGILLGLLIDFKFLRRWIDCRFVLPIWAIVLIYIVYNILLYGFFMGFPVFNALLGLLAGYYWGNRICFNKVETEKHTRMIKKASLFTGFIMALICIPSGFLALMDFGAAGMIKEVLGLDFEVTNLMMCGIVLIGGIILILVNILLTRIAIIKTIKYSAY